MFFQNIHVAAVGFEADVENIADEWHQTHQLVHENISSHVHEQYRVHAALVCFVNDVARNGARGGVAYARHQTENGMQPNADFRAEDDESIVHQVGELVQFAQIMFVHTYIYA